MKSKLKLIDSILSNNLQSRDYCMVIHSGKSVVDMFDVVAPSDPIALPGLYVYNKKLWDFKSNLRLPYQDFFRDVYGNNIYYYKL